VRGANGNVGMQFAEDILLVAVEVLDCTSDDDSSH